MASIAPEARTRQAVLCHARTHIDCDGAHEVHMCHAVSIEEEETSHRSVIVADAGYGPAGLGDAHIGFRDLRGRDGWPGRLPSAGRIGLQPEWLSATSERICSGRLSPERTGTALAGSTGCSSAGRRLLRGRWQPGGGFPEQGSSRSSCCGSTSWHVTPAPHAAEDGSWTCPTCGDCFDDSDIDQ